MLCRRVPEPNQAERGSKPRRREKRGGSQLLGSSIRVVLEHPRCQSIQLPSLDIRFELTVPCFSVEIGEPLPKCCELFGGKLSNLALDVLHFAHPVPHFRKHLPEEAYRMLPRVSMRKPPRAGPDRPPSRGRLVLIPRCEGVGPLLECGARTAAPWRPGASGGALAIGDAG